MCRRDHAHVHADLVVAAEPREGRVLEHLQQLGLRQRAHLGDLVEEQRAAVGHLELARLAGRRAGEGAALVAEQLALEQLARQRRAVHLHERPDATLRRRVQRAPVPLSPWISTVTSVSAT